ncbi:MAG: hypothetical protein K0Q94_1318 [Paenibacillus sp.]|nr:hypothetical protein [Paenibacillus sp.]
MWTTKWKGKDYVPASFVWNPLLAILINQGIPDNLLEQKQVTFHLERPAVTSTAVFMKGIPSLALENVYSGPI